MKQGYLLQEIESVLASLYQDVEQNKQAEDITDKLNQLGELSVTYKIQLSDRVFRISKEKQVCLVIENYHNALVLLMDDTLSRHTSLSGEIHDRIQGILEDLLYFIEKRFSAFLNPDLELPPHYIRFAQRSWKDRLERLKDRFHDTNGKEVFRFVSGNMLRFIYADRHRHLSLRALSYRKEIISEMEVLSDSPKMVDPAQGLHELLVYMNYNSKGYLEVYTQQVAAKANAHANRLDREHFLQRQADTIRRLYCNTAIGLHRDKEPLKSMILSWFTRELSLFSTGVADTVVSFGRPHEQGTSFQSTQEPPLKIHCTFSSGQLALLLRALDQAGLVKAPSLSGLYKAVVPFVSTVRKPELSVDSVRSKSYLFDEKAREDTIGLLEKMIEKIRKM